jgi:hypothetical protein
MDLKIATDTALRFSWVENNNNRHMQMLIPTTVVNNDYLDVRAKCFESKDKMLKEYSDGIINWDDKEVWDIKGDR